MSGTPPTLRPAIAKLAERHWTITLSHDPIWATQVGDERFADRLPDLRPSARDEAMSAFQGSLADSSSMPRAGLSRLERTTLDVIEAHARTELERRALGYDQLETVDQLAGPSTLIERLLEVQPLRTATEGDAFVGRLERVPDYLDGVIGLLHDGLARGIAPARVVVERVLRQVDALLDQPPARWRAVLAAPAPSRSRVEGAIRDRVVPAYGAYRAALMTTMQRARRNPGLMALARGDELYASRVRAWTSLEADPASLHEAGREELAAIRREQAKLARLRGHDSIRAAAADAARRTRCEDRQRIIHEARRHVARGWQAAGRLTRRRPATNCRVQAIDPAREHHILDYYVQPSADGSRPGTFHVNTRPGRALYQLASTAFHEGSPGHHLQTALEQEAHGRPAVLRFAADLVGGAFCEGWGLYAERLADEMGLYESDADRFGMLELQALRAARMVVDTGIHAMGWTRARALEVLADAWGDAPDDTAIEVDRYIALPGQALCYTVGLREIRRWRDHHVPPGNRQALMAFHDHLLDLGSLPLPSINREMEVFDAHA